MLSMTTPVPAQRVMVKGYSVPLRVLSYHRNGYFFILSPSDERLYRHRSALTFIP